MKTRFLFAVTLAALAAGCATTVPTRYYTLDMRPSEEPAGIALEVYRLTTAEAISSKDILIQTSPTEVEFYATDQWVAGLDEMVAKKLLAEFGPAPEGAPFLRVQGEIGEFKQVDVPGGAEAYVKLNLSCSLSGEGIKKSFDKTYEARVPVEANGNTVRGLSVALSRCVEQIAAQLAADAKAAMN